MKVEKVTYRCEARGISVRKYRSSAIFTPNRTLLLPCEFGGEIVSIISCFFVSRLLPRVQSGRFIQLTIMFHSAQDPLPQSYPITNMLHRFGISWSLWQKWDTVKWIPTSNHDINLFIMLVWAEWTIELLHNFIQTQHPNIQNDDGALLLWCTMSILTKSWDLTLETYHRTLLVGHGSYLIEMRASKWKKDSISVLSYQRHGQWFRPTRVAGVESNLVK